MKAAALALLLVVCPGWPLAAQGAHFEGGVTFASGEYFFTERTSTWTLVSGLAVSRGPVTLRASLPVYLQNSTLVAGSGIGNIPTGGSSGDAVADSGAARKRRDDGGGNGGIDDGSGDGLDDGSGGGGGGGGDGNGDGRGLGLPQFAEGGPVDVPPSAVTDYLFAVGDPVAQLSVRALDGRAGSVVLSAGAKVPVADTASFGTGEWDVGLGASLSRPLSSRVLLGLDLGWWYLGDPPELDLRNPLLGSLSLSALVGTGWGLSGGVSGATAVVEGFDPSVSVSAAVSRLGTGSAWVLHAAAGLTETAPDVAVGLSWRLRLAGP